MSLNHLLSVSLLSVQYFGGQLFLWMSAGQADRLEAPNPTLSLISTRDHGVTKDQQLLRMELWSSPRHLFIC